MPRKPEFLKTLHYRKKWGFLKDFSTGEKIRAKVEIVPKGLNKAIRLLSTQPIGTFKIDELKAIARPIIREAMLRKKELEKQGLEESPAYQFILKEDLLFSAAGTDINEIRKNVMNAFDFLHASTSVAENAKEYSDLIEKWFPNTSKEDRIPIWDAIRRLTDLHSEKFRAYDIEYSKIGKIAENVGYNADEIVKRYEEMIKEAEEKQLAEARELAKEGRSDWMKGNL